MGHGCALRRKERSRHERFLKWRIPFQLLLRHPDVLHLELIPLTVQLVSGFQALSKLIDFIYRQCFCLRACSGSCKDQEFFVRQDRDNYRYNIHKNGYVLFLDTFRIPYLAQFLLNMAV